MRMRKSIIKQKLLISFQGCSDAAKHQEEQRDVDRTGTGQICANKS